jgi:hypothetical protein
MKNNAVQSTKNGIWDKAIQWSDLVQWTRVASCLSEKEAVSLGGSLAGEILAATAFLSNCRSPARTAVSHLTTLVAAVRCRGIYSHRPGETLAERLLPLYHYPGGDPDVVRAGMLLLEYLSLRDHKEDMAGDIVHGKQNPLILQMDYDEERERILKEYSHLPAGTRECFGDIYEKVIQARWWWY